ncbi:hypothetical protein [Sphingobacterium siyangense]|uniref:hypothetical protein n=1 Tax=Sphingobacterium siyangense TaxID=459529 RepID=UPI0028ABEB14|nr:hypothetical protein [Sphingobacterium siyangense]
MLKLTISVIAVALAASSCSTTLNTKKMNTDTTGLSVKIQSTNAIAVKNPTGKIRLYAVSAQIADVPATMILEKSFTANQIPFDLKLDLPKNHLKLIQPKVSDAEPIKYYVTLDWDSNGDGEKGKGDISIDFNKKFPTVVIGQENEIFVAESK